MLVLASLVVSTAEARSSVPIVNHENIAITTGSKRAPSADEVSAAITRAGQTIRYPWTVTAGGPGQLVATTLVREKHTVVVDIKYSSTSYSVTYRDSQNMNYKVSKGVPKIHPFYNDWVDELIAAINAELLKL
jgi:hypothetical protein